MKSFPAVCGPKQVMCKGNVCKPGIYCDERMDCCGNMPNCTDESDEDPKLCCINSFFFKIRIY